MTSGPHSAGHSFLQCPTKDMLDADPSDPLLIVGLDPAPAKGTTLSSCVLSNGRIEEVVLRQRRKSPSSLKLLLHNWRQKYKNILLCWDAPLTGPPDPDSVSCSPGDYTIRPLERLLRARKWKVPGISVQGYAGCQHWAVSRNVLGLPRVGAFDNRDVPFTLVHQICLQSSSSHRVMEVHPAVALLFWLCRDQGDLEQFQINGLIYKGTNVSAIWNSLIARWQICGLDDLAQALRPLKVETDDDLDSVIALALGIMSQSTSASLRSRIVGGESTGSFLLPAGMLADTAEAELTAQM